MGLSKKELGDLRKAWTESPTAAGGGEDVPEGKYQMKIAEASIGKSGNGRVQCTWDYEIVGGDEELVGTKVSLTEGLETPENIGWFKRKLTRLGYGKFDLDDFDTIQEILEGISGLVFEGQVKHKDGFINVYANKLISSPGDDEEEAPKPKAKMKGKKAEEDEEEPPKKGPKKKAKAEEEEAEEEEAATNDDRAYPTLDKIGKMDSEAIQEKILNDFKLIMPKAKRKDVEFVREVAKGIVSIMEDDDYKPEKEVLQFIVEEGAGQDPKKTSAGLEQQIIDWLSEITG